MPEMPNTPPVVQLAFWECGHIEVDQGGTHPCDGREVCSARSFRFVALDEVTAWLMHVDRLSEIPGAATPGLVRNPLWDAAVALGEKFGRGEVPSALVAEREGILPNPVEVFAVQTIATIGHGSSLEVYWPPCNSHPLWHVRHPAGRGWLDRAELLRLRALIDEALDA